MFLNDVLQYIFGEKIIIESVVTGEEVFFGYRNEVPADILYEKIVRIMWMREGILIVI